MEEFLLLILIDKEAIQHNLQLSIPHLKSIPRVFGGKNLLLLAGSHMSVDLGSGDRAVAEKVLDVLDIDIRFEEERGKGMAEGVGRNIFTQVGLPGESANDMPYRLVGEGSSGAVDKERGG